MVRDLMRWDPFRDLNSMHRQLDDMFSGFWGSSLPSVTSALPAMDVYTEGDKHLVAEVQAPGFTKDDIEVSVDNDSLEIRGKKEEKEETGDKKRSYMVRQSSSNFYRRVRLPKHADSAKVDAHFENGILKVIVPFKELPQPKKIAIKSAK